MKLKVLNSGSSGNCYLLEDENEVLILEAGVDISLIRKSLGSKLKSVIGCLVSHEHL